MSNPCLFCQIVEKKIPAKLVYEDELVIAFEDIHPKAPVHLLIIPKEHLATLNDVGPTHQVLLARLFSTIQKLARERGIDQPGYQVVCNCNAGGGQVIFHLHFHLLGGRTPLAF